ERSCSAVRHHAVLIVGLLLDRDLVARLKLVVLEELSDGTATPEVELRLSSDVGLHRVGKTGVMQGQHGAFSVFGVSRANCIRWEEAQMIPYGDVIVVETARRKADHDAVRTGVDATPPPGNAPSVRQVCQVSCDVVVTLVITSAVTQVPVGRRQGRPAGDRKAVLRRVPVPGELGDAAGHVPAAARGAGSGDR